VTLEKLPAISKEVKQKYFGESSKQMFYDTYHDLRGKGKILVGGYEELDNILQQEPEDSVFLNPLKALDTSFYSAETGTSSEFPLPFSFTSTTSSSQLIAPNSSIELASPTYRPSSSSHLSDHDSEGRGSPSPTRRRGSSHLQSKHLPPLVLEAKEDLMQELAPETIRFNQGSPRAVFLNGCLKLGIPPLTAALLRKKINSTMNLAHLGIGRYPRAP
jgi:hypothetical protein